MYDYGERCPMSKATSLLCERWTLQIVREMFLGATRFSEFQKYLPRISPSLLNARLRVLVDEGVAIRKRIPEKRGYEYHLTAAGKSLAPVLNEMGRWGSRWIHGLATPEQQDIESLMRGIAGSIDTNGLPTGDSVFQFTYTDLPDQPAWYITVKDGKCEVCDQNLGHEVDVYFRSPFGILNGIWAGQTPLAAAREAGSLKVTGPAVYVRNLSNWFPTNGFESCAARPGEDAAPPRAA